MKGREFSFSGTHHQTDLNNLYVTIDMISVTEGTQLMAEYRIGGVCHTVFCEDATAVKSIYCTPRGAMSSDLPFNFHWMT
jgi:hypothetical protein